MLPREIYEEIVNAFEGKYSWLGKQFAEEFLYVFASYCLHNKLRLDGERIRTHLLLYWQQGWLKSSLLSKVYSILGAENCELMSDITKAALRGSVEHQDKEVVFIPPKVMRAPFIICTELGSITAKDSEDMNQLLLAMLEEGIITVDLVKFARLSDEQRKEIELAYNIYFNTRSSITYTVNSVVIAGTYNTKYVLDDAFISRWQIVYPMHELDSRLTQYVDSNKFMINPKVIRELRRLLKENVNNELLEKEWFTPLPDSVYSYTTNLSPRLSRSLKFYKVARLFWDLEVSEDLLIKRLEYILYTQEKVKQTLEDVVIELLRKNNKMTFDMIKQQLQVTSKELTDVLKHSRNISSIRENDKLWYYIKV